MSVDSALASLGLSLAGAVGWLVAIAIALIWWAVRRGSSAGRRWRARRRSRRALIGEQHAESLLEDAGFRVVDRQVRLVWQLDIDGAQEPIELRADLLVERDGRSFVAEVKTGDKAPCIATAATRRQLLEYLVAYQTDAVLLVDVEQGIVREVQFPI